MFRIIFFLLTFQKGSMVSMPYDFKINYAYDYLLSDHHLLLQRHTIKPVFILMENKMNLSVFQYAFQVKEFREKPLFPEDNREML